MNRADSPQPQRGATAILAEYDAPREDTDVPSWQNTNHVTSPTPENVQWTSANVQRTPANAPTLRDLLEWRQEVVHNALVENEPRTDARFGTASARAEFHDPVSNVPVLANFQHLQARRTERDRYQANRPLEREPAPSWTSLATPEGLHGVGLPPMSSEAHIASLPTDSTDLVRTMEIHQRTRRTTVLEHEPPDNVS